jgi:cobalt/nickel transport system ATP-binding protein
MKTVLEVQGLTFGYDAGQACLNDVSFSVSEGECLGIVGANGAGKSTLLWCLLGLLKAKGTVNLLGAKLSRRSLARVGVVFQNPEDQLFMPTLLQDVTLPLLNRGAAAEAAAVRAQAVLGTLGLEHLAGRPATRLSLGERKRASIAAALAGAPEIIFLDEPTAELDGRSVRQLTRVLAELPIARVITGHHLDFLGRLAGRLLVLSQGRIIAEGPTQQILSETGLLESAGLI